MLTPFRVEASIRSDLRLLKASPLINNKTQLVGLKYDTQTGVLSEVGLNENEL